MRRRLAAAVTLVALAALAAQAEPAAACSCAQLDPRSALVQADGAFVGTLLERRERKSGPTRSSADPVTLVFRVERAVKGQLGTTVAVETAASGASCGIEAKIGDRVGLFLYRDGNVWRSTLCSQIEPRKLLQAARPLPPPNGNGPVTLLVGGRFGSARIMTLDRRGRTLGYGLGSGETFMLGTCPRARRAAEIVGDRDQIHLAVRDLASLKVVFERRLPFSWGGLAPAAVACATANGDGALVFATNPQRPWLARIVRVTARRTSTVWRGNAVAAWLGPDRAYLTTADRGRALLAFSFATRRAKVVARLPAATGAAVPNADASAFAAVVDDEVAVGPSRLVVVHHGLARSVGIGSAGAETHWLDSARVAVFGHGAADSVRVYDRSLHLLARFGGWHARQTALAEGRAFGLSWNGTIQWARLPNGPSRELRELPSPLAHALVAVRR